MNTASETIRKALLDRADASYKEFQSALLPSVDPDRVIGVRTPDLRRYARSLAGTREAADFLEDLPHRYYEEDNLHAALIEQIRDFDAALTEVKRFLPYIDNWATCDGFCPKILRTDLPRLWTEIQRWLASDQPYVVRYALVRMTFWYLDAPEFVSEALRLAAEVKSDHYYVRMAQAWFFSIALVKQYDAALPYLTEHRLPVWVHNKAIQKAIESYRPSPEVKAYLKTLKRRKRAHGGNV